ncbi:hypothetical protein BCV72DRAFT_300397 [Rhizopus microsporus var. microsporus]|uniref:Uncharacterized protein n=2 Tax=Rhizopus microsporus TaxID=58291 RepID=A0A2G4SZP8_RHIZD|nr:uncharacterized protein RHIMIDRAFT_278552 [Rhizopus microsporus ATCC 52813]ORE12071.1 hypothetical protein BCV72DRAFT_300397 [Rhizopus microsporus var. microsporus]PHZ14238.1 hypothetical protein RHIMIDRAFT_278552 [Rhizopus microsporus ATCC 52813]
MVKISKAFAASFGALAGGAAGFYLLEMYKIQSKEQRLAMLIEKKKEYEQLQNKENSVINSSQ